MVCEICGEGPETGISVYRVNPKGEKGIWRCQDHLDRHFTVDPTVQSLVDAIESSQP